MKYSFIGLAVAMATAVVPPAVAENLVRNGDFSSGKSGWSLFVPGSSAAANPSFSVDDEAGPDGAAAIVMQAEASARFAVQSQLIDVEPKASYALSAMVNVAPAARLQRQSPGVLLRATFFDENRKPLDDEHVHIGPGGLAVTADQIGRLNRKAMPEGWVPLQATVKVPKKARYLQVALFLWSSNGPVQWAHVKLEVTP